MTSPDSLEKVVARVRECLNDVDEDNAYTSIRCVRKDEIEIILAELDRLAAMGCEVLDDTKRLDALDKLRDNLVQRDAFGDPELYGHSWYIDGQCYTVREAIDEHISHNTAPPEPTE